VRGGEGDYCNRREQDETMTTNTIPLDALRAITAIVTHADCPDGIASAMILHDALPGAAILFARHGAPETVNMVAEPGMLFCDFSPPVARVAEFIEAGAIVLDHHRTARDVVEAFGPRGVFGDEVTDPGVCGAVLAFREVWERVQTMRWRATHAATVGDLAALAGIRDTWQRHDPRWEEACEQAAALTFWPVMDLVASTPDTWAERMAIGPTLQAQRAESVTRAIRDGMRIHVDGREVAILSTTDTSDAMDRLGSEGVAMVLGFGYRCEAGAPRMIVSLRGRGVDVAVLARAEGGGGHTAAAGFTLDVGAEMGNPYRWASEWCARVLTR
jgi:hypothetical protein